MKQVDMLQAAGLEYSKDQIEAETLQILQPGDEMMTSLVNDFCHARQEQQQVMCFYETRRTIVGRIFGRQDMRVSDPQSCRSQAVIVDRQKRITLSIRALDVSIHRRPLFEIVR